MRYESNSKELEIEDVEVKLIIEALYLRYGYDFRDYSFSYLKRRIMHKYTLDGYPNLLEILKKVLYDKSFFEELTGEFSISITEMFRDPDFYKVFRKDVIPLLKTYPFIKIWHAGCSTGEEVYSMAILLKEEELYDRCQIFATDYNEKSLQQARDGIYHIDKMKTYTLNYQNTGGRHDFSDYYTATYDSVIFDPSLKERIVFAKHNLVSDGVFGEMNVILCRNVLIYFSKPLQNRVVNLFYESLCHGGILCLGTKESLKFLDMGISFIEIAKEERIYMKKYIT